jgi:hypothetical protein
MAMLLTLMTCFVFTIILLEWKGGFSRIVWATLIVFALAFSLAVANVSVSNVWVPVQTRFGVFAKQNALGEYEGTFPWARFSCPLSLNVYHTPSSQLTSNWSYHYGEVRFKVFLASMNFFQVNGTFSEQVSGSFTPLPFEYSINFIYSGPNEFHDFLIAVFTFFNLTGTLLGTIMACALHKKIHATSKIPSNTSISNLSENPTIASCANCPRQRLNSGEKKISRRQIANCTLRIKEEEELLSEQQRSK